MKHVFILLCIAFPVLCAAGKPERATTEMSLEELLDKMSVEDSSDSERENLLEPNTEMSLKELFKRMSLDNAFNSETEKLLEEQFWRTVESKKFDSEKISPQCFFEQTMLEVIHSPTVNQLFVTGSELESVQSWLYIQKNRKNIEELILPSPDIKTFNVLSYSEAFPNLKKLELNCALLRELGLKKWHIGFFLSKIRAPKLRALSIGGLTREDIEYHQSRITIEGLKSLTLLYIDASAISCIARTALKFRELTELHITHNNISYDQIKPLLQKNFESLQVLNLRCSRIGPRGAKYISGMQLNSLTTLDLAINHIGDKGAFHLRKLVAPLLSRICVESNDITPRGSASLVQGNWKKLALLSIHFLSDEVIKSNLQSEGECTLSEMISDGGENIGTHIKAAESLIKVIFAKKERPYEWEFRK